jgi:hypothetical protein
MRLEDILHAFVGIKPVETEIVLPAEPEEQFRRDARLHHTDVVAVVRQRFADLLVRRLGNAVQFGIHEANFERLFLPHDLHDGPALLLGVGGRRRPVRRRRRLQQGFSVHDVFGRGKRGAALARRAPPNPHPNN